MEECYFCIKSDMVLNHYCWRCNLPSKSMGLFKDQNITHQCKNCESTIINGTKCDSCGLELSDKNTPVILQKIDITNPYGTVEYKDLMMQRTMMKSMFTMKKQVQDQLTSMNIVGSDIVKCFTMARNFYTYPQNSVQEFKSAMQYKHNMNDFTFALLEDIEFGEDFDWLRLFVSSSIYLGDLYRGHINGSHSKFTNFITPLFIDNPENPFTILNKNNYDYKELSKIIYLLGLSINTNFMGHKAQGKYLRDNIINELTRITKSLSIEISNFQDKSTHFAYMLENINLDDPSIEISQNLGLEAFLVLVAHKLAVETLISEDNLYSNRPEIIRILVQLSEFYSLIALKTDPKNNKFISLGISSNYFSILNPLMWHHKVLFMGEGIDNLLIVLEKTFIEIVIIVSPMRLVQNVFGRTYEGMLAHGHRSEGGNWIFKYIEHNSQLLFSQTSKEEATINMLVYIIPIIFSQQGSGYHNLARYNFQVIKNITERYSISIQRTIIDNSAYGVILNNFQSYQHLPLKFINNNNQERILRINHPSFNTEFHTFQSNSIQLLPNIIETHIENARHQRLPDSKVNYIKESNQMCTGLPLSFFILEVEDCGKSWKSVTKNDWIDKASDYPIVAQKYTDKPYKIWIACSGSQTSLVRNTMFMFHELLSCEILAYSTNNKLDYDEILDFTFNAIIFPQNIDKITYHCFFKPPEMSTSRGKAPSRLMMQQNTFVNTISSGPKTTKSGTKRSEMSIFSKIAIFWKDIQLAKPSVPEKIPNKKRAVFYDSTGKQFMTGKPEDLLFVYPLIYLILSWILTIFIPPFYQSMVILVMAMSAWFFIYSTAYTRVAKQLYSVFIFTCLFMIYNLQLYDYIPIYFPIIISLIFMFIGIRYLSNNVPKGRIRMELVKE